MKQILITCDTEVGEITGNRDDAFEIFIEGKIDSQEVGYKLINTIASRYGAIVEHFIDLYPYHKYGEEKFKTLCKNILDDGHEIGLHTHPSSKYDKNRKYMWQYSLTEQQEIIKFGKDKLEEWSGIKILSHRAGGYGANNETLEALKDNNILIDSSYYFNNMKCKIKYPFINISRSYKNIYQVPVTIYNKTINYLPFNIKRSKYKKLDFRYGSNVDDILYVIKKSPSDCIIVLFLHSFNFLNLPYNLKSEQYDKITINKKLIIEYERLLKEISLMNDTSFTSNDALKRLDHTDDFLVKINSYGNMIKVIYNKFKNKKNLHI